MEKRDAMQYSPLTLAFLGDGVYEQLVREKLVLTANMPVGKLHALAVKKVRASYQAKAFDLILPVLNSDEEGVLRRGRNATGNTVPKSSNPIEYHKATAIESLFGYLHLIGNKQRIDEIFEIIWNIEE